jgi:hypothetical protein
MHTSEAISSRPDFCLSVSWLIICHVSGSTSFKDLPIDEWAGDCVTAVAEKERATLNLCAATPEWRDWRRASAPLYKLDLKDIESVLERASSNSKKKEAENSSGLHEFSTEISSAPFLASLILIFG